MKTYTPDIDPMGLTLSEKLDGVHGTWTGTEWLSRTGRTLNANVVQLPPPGTVGELHCGRGGFERTLSALQHGTPVQFTQHGADAVVCTGPAHLSGFYAAVIAGGGEGVVLGGEFKMKPCATDECTVSSVELNPSTGWLKAAVCDWRGVSVRIGSGFTFEQRARVLVEPGQVITFKYTGVTCTGQPRHASFVCVRDYE